MNLPLKGKRLQETQLYDKVTKLETIIIDKLADLRKKKLAYFCSHLNELPLNFNEFSPTNNYYMMFWQLFLTTETCRHKLELLSVELDEMHQQLVKIQILFNKRDDIRNENIKFKYKIRRKADEISRPYTCSFQQCDKAYGSQLALNLHLKMKHKKNRKNQHQKMDQN